MHWMLQHCKLPIPTCTLQMCVSFPSWFVFARIRLIVYRLRQVTKTANFVGRSLSFTFVFNPAGKPSTATISAKHKGACAIQVLAFQHQDTTRVIAIVCFIAHLRLASPVSSVSTKNVCVVIMKWPAVLFCYSAHLLIVKNIDMRKKSDARKTRQWRHTTKRMTYWALWVWYGTRFE